MTEASINIKAWIEAMRLRTLPLAVAVIAMGGFVAAFNSRFSWLIFTLAVSTTLFLQILSNLANDYGDSIHGADNADRIGPKRAVQTGAISSKSMKKAIYVFGALSLLSGMALIYFGLINLGWIYIAGFLGLGIMAIAAAIKYTAGDNPYGYKGLGDLFVFVFFGLIGVGGTYFLHTHQLNWLVLLPAASMGLLSVGVLNVNNMRDHISDKKAGKNSLVVKMGFKRAKTYHSLLIIGALVSAGSYMALNYNSPWQLLFLVSVPLLVLHLIAVLNNNRPQLLDKQLKILALSTMVFCITFGIGLVV